MPSIPRLPKTRSVLPSVLGAAEDESHASPDFWDRSKTLALAMQSCSLCLGIGMCVGRDEKGRVCHCVLRAIFRACYEKFKRSTVHTYVNHAASLGANPGVKRMWDMRSQEYAADFCLIARRVLSERQQKVFRFHFLLGADWRLCCPKLAVDRGTFFHDVYRIESKLGRAFAEVRPYALFPTDEYFSPLPRQQTGGAGVKRAAEDLPRTGGRVMRAAAVA
jgi:hypothetical protein